MNLNIRRQRCARACMTLALTLWLAVALALGGPAQPAFGQSLQTIAVTIIDSPAPEVVRVQLRGGKEDKVHLAGIEIPPCAAWSAASRISALTDRRWGYLELSSQQRNSNGYLVGYILFDTSVLNVELVRSGVARPSGAISRYDFELGSARTTASTRRIGEWGTGCLR